jgi:hypothetical protein
VYVIINDTSEEFNAENNPVINPQNIERGANHRAEGETDSTIAARENVYLSAAKWQMIKRAVNNNAAIPANSMREVLMGCQYVLHQQRKQLLWEKSEIRERHESASAEAGYYERSAATRHTLVEGDTAHQSTIGEMQNMETEDTTRKISTHHSYQSMKGEYCTKNTRGSLGGMMACK